MPAAGRFVQAQDLNKRSETVLQKVSESGEPCYITENGKAKAVLMDINRYNALMDLIEESESPKDHFTDDHLKPVTVRRIIERSAPTTRRRK